MSIKRKEKIKKLKKQIAFEANRYDYVPEWYDEEAILHQEKQRKLKAELDRLISGKKQFP